MQKSEINPIISLKNISRSFANGEEVLVVLKDISLDIYAGEFVSIVGTSGSGKSTLMNIIGCLDKSSSGEYTILNQEISTLNSDDLALLRRDAFGFVFQTYNLIGSLTAIENVEIPSIYAGVDKDSRTQKAKALLTSLGLENRLYHYPSQLSGGQQQRVSIARAIMNGGSIILADEPTGALDTKNGAEVMELFHQLSNEGHTIILITHDKEVASQANRVVELSDGKIISTSTNVDKKLLSEVKSQITKRKPSLFFSLREATISAFSSLKNSIFRTILTLLGIVIGVGSVISMLAIGDGAKEEVLQKFSTMGTNILIIRPGMANSRGFSNIVTLIPQDVQAIQELKNISSAIPETKRTVTLRYQNADKQTSMNATSADFLSVKNWKLSSGTFFTKEDDERYAKVAIIGQSVVKDLFGDKEPLGEYVMIDKIMFQIIGILSQKGASMNGEDEDDVIIVPFSTGSSFLLGERHLRNITVAITDTTKIEETQEEITQLLTQRHGGVEDVRVRNMASLIEDAKATQNTLTTLLGSIAAISLLVGGIGVMNIMLVSVTERTREIGIRMAVGASRGNILQQFLIEAITISALGGLIGVILGLGVTLLVESFGVNVSYSLFPVL